jgi:hypothetical protein
MARIRTIKPEIKKDEKLARVSRDARLSFIFAITEADDDGLLPGSPRQLLGSLFPDDLTVTDELLSSWVSELTAIGVLRRRETMQGAPILQISNWNAHQKISNRGKSLLLPTLRPLSAEPLEDEPRPSRSDPHIPISPTTVSPTVVAAAATSPVDLATFACVIANAAHGERFPSFTLLVPSSGASQEVAAAWEASGVDRLVVEGKIRDMIAGMAKPVSSLRYFRDAVLEAWETEKVRSLVVPETPVNGVRAAPRAQRRGERTPPQRFIYETEGNAAVMASLAEGRVSLAEEDYASI